MLCTAPVLPCSRAQHGSRAPVQSEKREPMIGSRFHRARIRSARSFARDSRVDFLQLLAHEFPTFPDEPCEPNTVVFVSPDSRPVSHGSHEYLSKPRRAENVSNDDSIAFSRIHFACPCVVGGSNEDGSRARCSAPVSSRVIRRLRNPSDQAALGNLRSSSAVPGVRLAPCMLPFERLARFR